MARDYQAELEGSITRRDSLLKYMETHNKFTVPFIQNVAKELTLLERNITDLTTCVELAKLREIRDNLIGGEMTVSEVIELARKEI